MSPVRLAPGFAAAARGVGMQPLLMPPDPAQVVPALWGACAARPNGKICVGQ